MTNLKRARLFRTLFVGGILSSGLAFAAAPKYAVESTFKLGGEGRWDYATLADGGKTLYISRTTHVMVIDTATGKLLGDVAGQQGNHGVAVVPAVNRGFISDGKEGVVVIFDLKTYQVLGKIKAAEDADGIIYDAFSNKVLVVCGDASSLIAIAPDVDPKDGKADATVDLGGKPEFFASDGEGKIFVNLNDKNEVAVLDAKSLKIISRWPTGTGTGATGLAIDSTKKHLLIGCRNQKLVVMNIKDGSIEAELPIGKGVDATGAAKDLGFASCGDGTLAIAQLNGDGKWEIAETVKTLVGARTMAVDGESGKVYLPASDMSAPTTAPANGRPARPTPVPGSFKIVVVAPKP